MDLRNAGEGPGISTQIPVRPRCGHDRTPYDEATYPAACRQRNSPLAQTLQRALA
jgi:hypothetical protein